MDTRVLDLAKASGGYCIDVLHRVCVDGEVGDSKGANFNFH
jgi:hypothetical protein